MFYTVSIINLAAFSLHILYVVIFAIRSKFRILEAFQWLREERIEFLL